MGISHFQISGQYLYSKTSHDIDMKFGPITKIDKKKQKQQQQRQKNLVLTSCRKIATSLSFFEFLANLEQSRGWILDKESTKVVFSVIVTFCLTKTENKSKKSLTQLLHCCF